MKDLVTSFMKLVFSGEEEDTYSNGEIALFCLGIALFMIITVRYGYGG